ncbi:MAG TPA: hydroxymethylbilane synthase [Streptosporangiaceae bacterium]|jgi:hydroxymethylbilane synthase|nr:hydroxymethylbilane synthase [Streptosporangiaceae bacterium]
MSRPLRLGSRRSPMAIAQSRQVAEMITERTGRAVEIVGVATLGDVSRAQLTQIGGTGVFVSALREALAAGEVDLAVHSLKDLPSAPAAGIVLAAVPPRDDPRDALIARDGAKLADLPAAARIGTGSPRRAAQLLGLRGDLRCVPIRGNAGTRLAKVERGELDGVILACAGLARIGRASSVSQVFEPDEMLPAPGQGALAVECREGEPELAALLATVTDPASMAAVTAERSLLQALAAGCSAPVGAYAEAASDGQGGWAGWHPPGSGAGSPAAVAAGLTLRAAVMSGDGSRVLRARGGAPATLDAARRLGLDLAAQLLRAGAADLISVPSAPTSTGNDVS